MAKAVTSIELDNGLTETAVATAMHACSAQPTTYTEAVTTFNLATTVMTAGDGNGSFVLADGDAASARKLRVLAVADVTIGTSGTANHVALTTTTGGNRLLAVTTCADLPLTAGGGNTVSFPEWKREIPQPT